MVIGRSIAGGVVVTGVPSSDSELIVQVGAAHSESAPAESLSRLREREPGQKSLCENLGFIYF